MLVPDSSILLSLVDNLLCTQNNTRIETIDLEGNDIGPRGAKYLTRALRENVFVTELVSVFPEVNKERSANTPRTGVT